MKLSDFPVYSVSQINEYIKELMDDDMLLQSLLVRGEVSNYKCYPSGHHYFSLKDEKGSIRCVMFRGDAVRLRFRPTNGMRVVAFGRVSVFPRDGQYQLYCAELLQDGRGALDEAFERLRLRLEQEGLFDPAHKAALPRYPGKIALITSPAGAAVRDMLRILSARWPMTEVLVVPVRVQGQEAAGEIAAAIHEINNRADIDLIITGRGGGSKEDLWAFNEEIVARAIYLSNIPVISAVGHEPDVTIADYVADLRAATPSNGAELAVPDQAEVRMKLVQLSRRLVRAKAARMTAVRKELEQLTRRLARAEQNRLSAARKDLDRLKDSRILRNVKAPIEERRLLVDSQRRRLATALAGKMKDKRGALARLAAGLDAMSPLKVLGRGYAIARTEKGAVTSIQQVQACDRMDVLVSDGVLKCEVREKEERTWQ